VALLHDQLRQVRTTIEDQYHATPNLARGCFKPPFPVLAPTEIVGYDVDAIDTSGLQGFGAGARARLVDRTEPQRWLELRQSMGCFGAGAEAPPGARWYNAPHPVEVPGLAADKQQPQLESWKERDGSSMLRLVWYSDIWSSPNAIYHLTGHNISEEFLLRIASSMALSTCAT
jgi:hypothetical protein